MPKSRRIKTTIKIGTFLGAAVFASNRFNESNMGFNNKEKFKANMNLIYPHFEFKGNEDGKSDRNYGDVVTRTQLQHVIQQCNNWNMNIKVLKNHEKDIIFDKQNKTSPIENEADIYVDISPMNKVIEFDQIGRKITVESGIKIKDL